MGPHGYQSPLERQWTDQVIRKRRFVQANPDVEIVSPRTMGGNEWVASWPEENGSTTIHRSDLTFLLDALEQRFPTQEATE